MAKQTINIGASANDGTGDNLRAGMDKANDNFSELYTLAGSALQDVVDDTTPQLGNDLDCQGNRIDYFRQRVITGVSGALTSAAHSGGILVTTGNITIPNGSSDVGFNCVVIAGGGHTVTFNSTTSPALSAGDIMTLFVQSTTVIRAAITPVGDQVVFS